MASSENLSYASAPMLEPYLYTTIPDRLRILATECPNNEAFVFYDLAEKRTAISRQELHEKSLHLAKLIAKLGLQKGTHVGICMNNSIESLIVNMGVICSGCLPFYFASNLKDGSDVIEVMSNMKCELLIIDTNTGDANWDILNFVWPIGDEKSKVVPTLKHVLCNGNTVNEGHNRTCLRTFMKGDVSESTLLPDIQPEDTLCYFCTSGSTGKLKEVIYTHFGILNWTRQTNAALDIKKDSRFFCDRTFSWVLGFPRTYLIEGTTRIFIDPKVSISGDRIEHLCDIIEAEKCDVVYLPGYLTFDLLKNPQLATKFKMVKSMFLSGERVPKSSLAIKDTFCKVVHMFYGNTECGGALAMKSDNLDDYEDGLVGKPLKGGEIKITDKNGHVVPVGQSGELCIRTPFRFAGYRNMVDTFHESVDTGNWFLTGDISHMRKDGHVVIEGRFKEVISMQTMKFFPWTIEKVLKKIRGVDFAIAVGVPDERSNQVVCACVFPKPEVSLTADDVKTFCDESFLDTSTAFGIAKKPKYFLIFKKLPLTRSGKIDRRTIGIMAKERLGL